MNAISNDQLRAIHIRRRDLGIDDDTYRDMLDAMFGVRSSKHLSSQQASRMLDQMTAMQKKIGVTHPARKPRAMKYDELANRDAIYASPKQMRMIEAMWSEVSRKETPHERERALCSLLFRLVKRSHITMLERRQVRTVVKALKAMKANPRTHQPGDDNGISNSREEGGDDCDEWLGAEGRSERSASAQ